MKKLTITIEYNSVTSMDKLLSQLHAEIMKGKTEKNGHAFKDSLGCFKIEEIVKSKI
jgi:hypothetical protein